MFGFQENPSIRSWYTAKKVFCSPSKLLFIICRSQPNLQCFVGRAQSELGMEFQENPSNESWDTPDEVINSLYKESVIDRPQPDLQRS